MSDNKRPRGKWFAIADSAPALMRAIIDTHERVELDDGEAGAEHWVGNDVKFAEIRAEIVRRWAALAEAEEYQFPFHDNYVREGWVDYRKSAGAGRERIRLHCGLGVGAAGPMFPGS